MDDGTVARVVYEGDYFLNKRGKPRVSMDAEAIATELDEVIFDNDEVIVRVQKAKLKARPKKDGTIKLKLLVKFTATLENTTFKFTLGFKGLGDLVE